MSLDISNIILDRKDISLIFEAYDKYITKVS